MGKKQVRTKSPEEAAQTRSPRKEPYSSQRMAGVVDRLREQANRISSLARLMDESGISDIEVDGHAMLSRGLNQVDNFTDNAQRAVREAKTQIDPI